MSSQLSIIDKIQKNDELLKLIEGKMGKVEFIAAARQLIGNSKLNECVHDTIIGCLLNAAILGLRLSPTLGECWIIARNSEQSDGTFAKVAVFQVGYKGWEELVYKTGMVTNFDYECIYTNDTFDHEKGTNQFLRHKKYFGGDRGYFIGAWAKVRLLDGSEVFDVATFDEIERHRRMSETQKDPQTKMASEKPLKVWGKHYDAMAVRIPIVGVTKRLSKTEGLAKAIQLDGSVTRVTENAVEVETQSEVIEEQILSLVEAGELPAIYSKEIDECETKADLKGLYNMRVQEVGEQLKSLYLDAVTKKGKSLNQ